MRLKLILIIGVIAQPTDHLYDGHVDETMAGRAFIYSHSTKVDLFCTVCHIDQLRYWSITY